MCPQDKQASSSQTPASSIMMRKVYMELSLSHLILKFFTVQMTSYDSVLAEKLESAAAASNHNILLEPEILRARNLLRDAEHLLTELNGALTELTARRDAQHERVRKYRVILAPHKRLASELLSEIFLHCLSATTLTLSTPPTPKDAPWILGQVCARWRRVSRADSRLWLQTKISLYDRPSSHLARACELLPPAARLSVTYCGSSALLSTALLPYLWRIQDLILRMGVTDYNEFLRITSPGDFVALQSADLHVTDGKPGNMILCDQVDGLFQQAKGFRRLKVEAAGGFRITTFDIPLGQLTSLNLSGVIGLDTQTLFTILRDCHQLEQLDLAFAPHDSPSIEEPFYLPRLQNLRVRGHLPTIFEKSVVWENIAYLNLASVTNLDSQILFALLKESINLTELHCRASEKGAVTNLSGSHALLPRLKKLALTNVIDTWIFESLIVPSLKELHIHSTELSLPPAVREMIVQSGAKILSFWFQSTQARPAGAPANTIHELLAAIPSAVHFDDTHSILDLAAMRDIATGTLLPHVEYLRCWPNTQEAFLDMVEARVRTEAGVAGTLQQAFGVSPIGAAWTPVLTSASHLRLAALRVGYGLVCSLYPPPVWDDYSD
ncbi:hypothetical protein H0H87_003935 [Tephrocybe sp. NHM501043]|nr:hypothetical protein H0H87_003935 [Tephrocybe sp. NHM501043]